MASEPSCLFHVVKKFEGFDRPRVRMKKWPSNCNPICCKIVADSLFVLLTSKRICHILRNQADIRLCLKERGMSLILSSSHDSSVQRVPTEGRLRRTDAAIVSPRGTDISHVIERPFSVVAGRRCRAGSFLNLPPPSALYRISEITGRRMYGQITDRCLTKSKHMFEYSRQC
jgi:hypothetical protein